MNHRSNMSETQLALLRQKYKEARTDQEKEHIMMIAEMVKSGVDRFGSVENGGNGFCYQCLIGTARPGRWTCFECAGVKGEKDSDFIKYMTEKVEEWKKRKGIKPQKTIDEMTDEEIEEVIK